MHVYPARFETIAAVLLNIKSSEMWGCVARIAVSDVPKDSIAFIVRFVLDWWILKMKEL
jgi:hypothetical protein